MTGKNNAAHTAGKILAGWKLFILNITNQWKSIFKWLTLLTAYYGYLKKYISAKNDPKIFQNKHIFSAEFLTLPDHKFPRCCLENI